MWPASSPALLQGRWWQYLNWALPYQLVDLVKVALHFSHARPTLQLDRHRGACAQRQGARPSVANPETSRRAGPQGTLGGLVGATHLPLVEYGG